MWADSASKVDMLAYEPYADLLYEIATDQRVNPLTIGLYGSWGSGKSTILNLIQDKTKSNEKNVTVFVNAWMFEGYDDAKSALMEVILRTLEENQALKQKIGDRIKSLKDRVDWFRLGSSVVKTSIPAVSALLGNPLPLLLEGIKTHLPSNKEDVEKTIQSFSVIKDYIKEETEENIIQNIRLFRKEFSEMIDKSDIENLIIIIDDLDRCSPERIIETLEAIKLFLAVERTTFIIAIDEDVVSYAVQVKYPKLEDFPMDITKDYIEKIIQVPIKIPILSNIEIKNYLLLLICEMYLNEETFEYLLNELKNRKIFVKGEIISKSEISQIIQEQGQYVKSNFDKTEFEMQLNTFDDISEIIATTLKGNPRQAKRFSNTFFIRKKLAEIQGLELNLNVLAKLMVLEYTNIELFRELYSWQVNNEGKAEEIKEVYHFIIEEGVLNAEEGFTKKISQEWFKPISQEWLKVDPVELHEIDLRPYYYLAKDSIKEKHNLIVNLTAEERRWVNEICVKELNDQLRVSKVIELKKNTEVDHTKIFKGIVSKYRLEKVQNAKILIFIFQEFESFRSEVLKELKLLNKDDINPTIIKHFNTIKKISSADYASLKDYFVNQLKVDLKLWERIENLKK